MKYPTPHERIQEAYIRMAKKVDYRPAAPSDGCGNLTITVEQLNAPGQLSKEANSYATTFIKEENRNEFMIGCADYSHNRALAYTIEAARLLCGIPSNARPYAIKMLELALAEVKDADRIDREKKEQRRLKYEG